MPLTEAEQKKARARNRRHWETGVAFNRACQMTIPRWDADGVEMRLPLRDDLTAHPGVFHGGVISALIDTAGCAAVAAGHDYNYGNRITTIALSVQYQTVEPGSSVVAYARCTRRGRQINYAEVVVRSDGGKELARGLVTVSATGRRDAAPSDGPERENHAGSADCER
jgi:uncharacterized protein (TIGR00369 family)